MGINQTKDVLTEQISNTFEQNADLMSQCKIPVTSLDGVNCQLVTDLSKNMYKIQRVDLRCAQLTLQSPDMAASLTEEIADLRNSDIGVSNETFFTLTNADKTAETTKELTSRIQQGIRGSCSLKSVIQNHVTCPDLSANYILSDFSNVLHSTAECLAETITPYASATVQDVKSSAEESQATEKLLNFLIILGSLVVFFGLYLGPKALQPKIVLLVALFILIVSLTYALIVHTIASR